MNTAKTYHGLFLPALKPGEEWVNRSTSLRRVKIISLSGTQVKLKILQTSKQARRGEVGETLQMDFRWFVRGYRPVKKQEMRLV